MQLNIMKKKKLFILSVLFAICMALGLWFNGSALSANAAAVATPKYTMQLDYSIKTVSGSTSVWLSQDLSSFLQFLMGSPLISPLRSP